MELSKEEIDSFNTLYDKACSEMDGLIILESYRPTALTFFEKQRINRAEKFFKKALEIYPESWQVMFFLGKIFQRLLDNKTALSYFESAMVVELSNHNIPQEASLAAMQLGQVDLAIKYSMAAIARKPDDPGALGNHSMNLLIAGRFEEAKSAIDRALLLNPEDKINLRIREKINRVILGKEEKPNFQQVI